MNKHVQWGGRAELTKGRAERRQQVHGDALVCFVVSSTVARPEHGSLLSACQV